MFVPHERLSVFIKKVLLNAGVREDVAYHVNEGLVQASLRGVDSHGIRLFPHYMASVKAGRINPDPEYKFERTSASTGKFDADHTFGHAAGIESARKAVELAKEAGTGSIAVFNSTHFGAAAYFTLEIAKQGMIGLSFTHADSLMKTYAGKRAFLGTNPISFAAPVEGEEPFCLDMATTLYNFNKIKQLRERKHPAPEGVGADTEGNETTDADKISMLLPMGGYKGYGLSLMVEVLCGILTGMPYGPNISSMFKAPLSQKRFLGHFICAMRIDCFQEEKVFKRRMAELLNELRNEPPMEKGVPVQVAGDPEKKAASERTKEGIPMAAPEAEAFMKLSAEYGVEFI
ncbi:MAG: Ldh family oxidoreductase [Candidatus Omnitrophota bacterium]